MNNDWNSSSAMLPPSCCLPIRMPDQNMNKNHHFLNERFKPSSLPSRSQSRTKDSFFIPVIFLKYATLLCSMISLKYSWPVRIDVCWGTRSRLNKMTQTAVTTAAMTTGSRLTILSFEEFEFWTHLWEGIFHGIYLSKFLKQLVFKNSLFSKNSLFLKTSCFF